MRIKLDENLPTSLVEALVQLGHNADSVHMAFCSSASRIQAGGSTFRRLSPRGAARENALDIEVACGIPPRRTLHVGLGSLGAVRRHEH